MDASLLNRIKDCCIYLRKSRGDTESLEKHREDLIELCGKNGWKYVEYAEIGSSQKFDERPKLVEMLKDIEDDMYDAVVVMDKDRLSREGIGQSTINKLLADHDCLIVTPQKIYDLSNDTDMMMTEFEDLMARYEYRTITKRFRRGKKRGSKLGFWTNGTPPFPYYYEQHPDLVDGKRKDEDKKLKVDDEKLLTYRFIVEEFVGGNSPYNIAWELNKMKVKAPKGAFWYDRTIIRLLKDETHLGRIITNKTSKWKRSKGRASYTVNKRDDWIVVENCHKAVKTFEEHEKILTKFAKHRKPYYARGGTFALSGLIRCSKCGRTMSLMRKENGYPMIKKCQYYEEDGVHKCGNKGGSTKLLVEEIQRQLYKYKEDIEKRIKRSKSESSLSSTIQREITKKENQLSELEAQLEQVTKLALASFFTPEEAVQQKQKISKEIDQLENDIYTLNKQNDNFENMTNSERIKAIDNVLEVLNDKSTPAYKINQEYKSIIDSIIWDRSTDGEIIIQVNFL